MQHPKRPGEDAVNRDTHISSFIPHIYPALRQSGWLRDISVGNSKPVIPHQRKNFSKATSYEPAQGKSIPQLRDKVDWSAGDITLGC
jgi:hypothetical protein